MKAPPRTALPVLAALLLAGAPVPADDCNRNGIEDRVEIETPAVDFRLASEVEVASARSLVALDLDGDGDDDLVVDAGPNGGLVLLRNDGTGRLGPAGSVAAPRSRRSLRAADLDRDSDLDLVLLLDFEVGILWNDSDATFSRSTRLQVGSGPRDLGAADLDLDGHLDVITANFNGDATVIQNVSVLRNDGARTFAPPRNFASIKGQPVLCVADPDGDGDIDAVVGALEGGDLRLLENDGGADFSRAGPPQSFAGLRLTLLAPADLDGDGRDEVLALHPPAPASILVLSHAGGGGLEMDGEITVPGQTSSVLTRDITGDGRVDLVFPGCPGIRVIEGAPGALGEPRSFWFGALSTSLVTAELDGDDLPDLAAIRADGRAFTLIQKPSASSRDCNRNGILDECEPDCDRNGSPDDCDLSTGISPDCDANGVPDPCDPDCDANGVPDACDIAADRSRDCDGNGVPDACESARDADGNGAPDACDIARDPTLDCDANGKLDLVDVEPLPRFVQEEYELGGGPRSARLADMDGDGDSDVVAGTGDEGLSILEQLEDGTFARPRMYPIDAPIHALAALDVDADGDLDLAIGMPGPCRDGRGWVSVLSNRGALRLGRGPGYEMGAAPLSLEPADLDGDGILDIAGMLESPPPTPGPLWALAGRGDGTFAQPLLIAETGGPFIAGDLDGNGSVDIATGKAALINQGRWVFIEGSPLDIDGQRIGAGDIDGDSDLDLVVKSLLPDELSVLANEGMALFTPRGSIVLRNPSGPFALGDFDGDARADVAATTRDHQSAVSVFLSRGTGFAEVSPAAPASETPALLLAGDVDADGLDDVVVADFQAASVTIQGSRGSGVLSSRSALAPEEFIISAAMADIDGDLDTDIAAIERSGKSSIMLFENDGKASYALRTVIEHDLEPRIIRLADVDADGKQDIIMEDVREDELTTGFSVLRNDGEWTFRLEHREPAASRVLDLAVADFDADGDVDVARLHRDGGLSVVLNDGGGWGDPTVTPTGLHPTKLHVANAGGDGFADVLVVGSNEIRLLRGARGGRFKTPTKLLSLPGRVPSAVADVDADGHDDLIVARAVDCDSSGCLRIEIYGNVAMGRQSMTRNHVMEDAIHALLAADLDRDGDLDIVAAIVDERSGPFGSHLRLITSSEQGLRRGRKITAGSSGAILEARDVDGDGDADVVSAGRTGLFVIRNDTPPPVLRDADRDGLPDECERAPFRRGEADQDGALGLSDAIAILGVLFQGGPLPACPAALDADDSGRLEVTDSIRILGHLFLGRGPLPEPFAECGPDPTPDALACSQFGPCA